MSLVVIDGDLVGFKASAACETRFIRAVHKASGREKEFKHRTEFKDWLKSSEKWSADDFELIDDRSVDPIENCLHTVKVMIKTITEASGCSETKVVVQGDGNFRDSLLLPTKYKGGREDTLRPFHLKEVQDYLVRKYKAELAHGRESDDVLAQYAFEGFKSGKRVVQATVDKDAKQCMGWLYNWDKMDKPKFVSGLGKLELDAKNKVEGYGRIWLGYQCLVGDQSDSYNPTEIAGIRYGEKSAYKDLVDVTTDKEMWEVMVKKYKEWYPEPVTYTAWNGEEVTKDYLDLMEMYLDCAHMRRSPTDKLVVKEVLDRLGVEYGNP